MKHFHAHIYFTNEKKSLAQNLLQQAAKTDLFDLVKFHDKAVGPHPTPMFELYFDDSAYEAVISWVEVNCKNFSVLIHQDTGDDVKDHTEGIRWLGKSLPLDFGFFELIQKRPELRINN